MKSNKVYSGNSRLTTAGREDNNEGQHHPAQNVTDPRVKLNFLQHQFELLAPELQEDR